MTSASRSQHVSTDPLHHGLSPFVCACFTLNYLIGTGFLTLPWAFDTAGLLLSTATMVFTCWISCAASDYILSAMARANVVAVTEEQEDIDEDADTFNVDEESKLLVPATSSASTANKSYQSVAAASSDKATPADVDEQGKLLVGERKYELTSLCQIFLGNAGLLAYGISASLDIYGFLWAYSSVFGNAMSQLFPLGFADDYSVWLCIFAVIVTPMSLMHLSEQATIQVCLSACRIVMLLLMVCTPLAAAIFGSGGDPVEGIAPTPHFGEQTEPAGTVWFDFGGFHKMFPAIVFSLLFHQAVPGLADEMIDKRQVGLIFGYTYALCGIAYSLVGIVGAWYFGSHIYSSANITWRNYHGGTGSLLQEENTFVWTDVALWARIVKIFVVSFPAIDVISAFPIYAYVLGNTLMGIAHADNIDAVQKNRKMLTMYRTIAALPPIVGALFFRELGTITDYSGLLGLAIAFCFPPLLYIASEKRLKDCGAAYETRYERTGRSRFAAMAMFWFGVISIIFCFILLTFV